jgi:hypothetical protein
MSDVIVDLSYHYIYVYIIIFCIQDNCQIHNVHITVRYIMITTLRGRRGQCSSVVWRGLQKDVVDSFKSQGYVVVKRSPGLTNELYTKANDQVMDHYIKIKETLKYRVWRRLNKIYTTENRHSVPLPPSNLLETIMKHSITKAYPFLNTILPSHSPLVELASLISLPGKQK